MFYWFTGLFALNNCVELKSVLIDSVFDMSVLDELDCVGCWNSLGEEVAEGDMDDGTEEDATDDESESDDEMSSWPLLTSRLDSLLFALFIKLELSLYWARIDLAGLSELLEISILLPADCILM